MIYYNYGIPNPNAVHEHRSRPARDRFTLAELLVGLSYGISSDGFIRIITPAFSAPPFAGPHDSGRTLHVDRRSGSVFLIVFL